MKCPLMVRSITLGFLVIGGGNAFQVEPGPRLLISKEVVQSASVLSRIPIDDYTYSPIVPCPSLRRDWGVNLDLIDADSINSEYDPSDVPLVLPLSYSGITTKMIPPRRNATPRTVVGLDDNPAEYWFHNKIHTLGNTGPWGGIHAVMAPLVTRMIDDAAYNGMDVRKVVANHLRDNCVANPNEACIIDFCSGVGMSTRALSESFKDARVIVGVDTSPEMISMARSITKFQKILRTICNFKIHSNFVTDLINLIVDIQIILAPSPFSYNKEKSSFPLYARGNVERIKVPESSFDLVTIMFAFHEIPKSARYRILREARRLLKQGGVLSVVDISEDFDPPSSMLAGEPYVKEYQKNIRKQMDSLQGFTQKQSVSLVPGHVHMWTCTRKG